MANIIPLNISYTFIELFFRLLRSAMKIYLFIASLLVTCIQLHAQNMLGYITPQGDYYVSDDGKLIHLEHQTIRSQKAAAGSIAYVTSTGDLKYYAGHTSKKLDISNPSFYYNTDYYLYYSTGGNFSIYNGIEKKFLGNIQNQLYGFGDSIAAVHDFSDYFYIYVNNRFIEIEQNPVKKIVAGDNLIAYINHIDQFKIFYDYQKYDADEYPPITMQAGANTVAFIDSYHYLKVFYRGKLFELYNVPEIICLETPATPQTFDLPEYCDAEIVYEVESGLSLFKTGDDLVAYLDDMGKFNVFYKGNTIQLEQQPPLFFEVTDNVVYYADNNNYFKVFMNGELSVVETFIPTDIKADKNVVAYKDLDKRLKAFYNGNSYTVSESIAIDFELNNTLIMYSDLPNKYKFYSLE